MALRAGAAKKGSSVGHLVRHQGFRQLAGELQPYCNSDDIKLMEKTKGSALVLPFVKGLRLSARLIYILRTQLSDTQLEVDWGHLLDPNERSCSPECDVIIHKKGCAEKWNGDSHPVMDFRFIPCGKAVAVVSCKSKADSVDRDYPTKLRPYVRNVLLFAERCEPGRVGSLRTQARKAGYVGFWYLYTHDEETNENKIDPKVWEGFLKAVRNIVQKSKRRRSR
jgi:hypothetical protein